MWTRRVSDMPLQIQLRARQVNLGERRTLLNRAEEIAFADFDAILPQ